MQTCSPLTAKLWFKFRDVVNLGVAVIIFTPLFFVLMFWMDPWLAFVFAAGVAFLLFFFVLDKRPIRIRCPYGRCQMPVETNTPWICGHKGCRNDHPDEFPFIYKCEHCGYQPKAYKCHHCGELIFFTDDEQTTGYAECANYLLRAQLVKKREVHQEMVTNKKEIVEGKGLDVAIGKLDIRLKGINKVLNPPPPPPPSPAPRMPPPEAELAAFMNKSIGKEDAAEKLRAKVKAEWEHDPVECEKRLLLIDQWMRENS